MIVGAGIFLLWGKIITFSENDISAIFKAG